MNPEVKIRQATVGDAQWIVDLSTRVQESLRASGSLQEIGPLALTVVETSIRGGYDYVLEKKELRVGSVLVEPLDGFFPNTQKIQYVSWGVDSLPGPLWYLHSLMIEPLDQGKGLGLIFLDGVRWLVKENGGTIILDCWAGNINLRKFYEKAGFIFHGDFPENDYQISVYSQAMKNYP